MKKFFYQWILPVITFFVFTHQAYAVQKNVFFQEYNAMITSKIHSGNKLIKSLAHIYVNHQQVRLDTLKNKAIISTIIVWLSQKTAFDLNPQSHTYFKLPFQTQQTEAQLLQNAYRHTKFLGNDRIHNIACKKIELLGNHQNIKGYLWMSRATHYPILFESPNKKYVTEWSHFQPGPQPASLFKIPANYHSVGLFSLGSIFSKSIPHPSFP
jgi:hypothetical protein